MSLEIQFPLLSYCLLILYAAFCLVPEDDDGDDDDDECIWQEALLKQLVALWLPIGPYLRLQFQSHYLSPNCPRHPQSSHLAWSLLSLPLSLSLLSSHPSSLLSFLFPLCPVVNQATQTHNTTQHKTVRQSQQTSPTDTQQEQSQPHSQQQALNRPPLEGDITVTARPTEHQTDFIK